MCRPCKAAGTEYTVWGYVTWDSPNGPPVPGTAVRCNTVVGSSQTGTPPAYPGIDGYYALKFEGAAEKLRIYLEVPEDMEVVGNSTCRPCGPWEVNLVVCVIPPGQNVYNIGPISFFVRYLIPPTAMPTSTRTQTLAPTATPTAAQTSTPTTTPTETPYLMPTAKPGGRPTPDTFLGVAQRQLENSEEFVAIFRYFVVGVLGALATAGYISLQAKRS